MSQEITQAPDPVVGSGPLNPADVARKVELIQQVMAEVMKEGEHYGTIPGCGDKKTLLQPGAQVLALTFRLAPTFDIETRELADLHREYVVTCNLVSITTGQLVGSGVGSCTTMESRYRYRNVSDFEITGDPIPPDAKENKAAYRKQGFGMKKLDDGWAWVRYKDSSKVENPDIADTYNTVLKMATKRAFVHAVLNATAASDMFTQDVGDDETDETASAPPQEDLADESILKKLRGLRESLGYTDAEYAKAIEYYGASVDTELTARSAAQLVAIYDRRLAAKTEAVES